VDGRKRIERERCQRVRRRSLRTAISEEMAVRVSKFTYSHATQFRRENPEEERGFRVRNKEQDDSGGKDWLGGSIGCRQLGER